MIKLIRPIHNDICILYDTNLVRVVGVAEDERDLYYIVRDLEHRDHPEHWASAVGHIVSLNGIYPEERYKHMDDVFRMNGAERSEEFIVIVEE